MSREIHAALGLGDRVRIKTNLSYHDVQREYAAHDCSFCRVAMSRRRCHTWRRCRTLCPSFAATPTARGATSGRERTATCSGRATRRPARALESIIADRDRLVEMGERSHALVLSEHSPAKYVETMLALARGDG